MVNKSKDMITIHTHEGTLPGQPTTLWGCLLPFSLSEDHGEYPCRYSWCICPYRGYVGYRQGTGGAPSQSSSGTRKARRGWSLTQCSKCSFLLPSVEYLRHKISAAGVQPASDKIEAIQKALEPPDVS